MPYDLARSYFSRDKSNPLFGWNRICIHSENYLSEDERKKIIDGEFSSRAKLDMARYRTKHSYGQNFRKISCTGCLRRFYGRNINYDSPSKCFGDDCGSYDGLDGCTGCYSRFSHNPHIRIISTNDKWRGIMAKRRMLPQRINSNISRGSCRKDDMRRYCELKKEENAKFIKSEIKVAHDSYYC